MMSYPVSSIVRIGSVLLFVLLPGSLLFGTGPLFSQASVDPLALYLTWQRDPTTTMTIHWHTDGEHPSRVEYQRLDGGEWHSRAGQNRPFPHSPRTIHTVELRDLEPNTTYRFRLGEAAREFRFRTMPATAAEPIRFATGGDVMHQREWMEATSAQAAKYNPHFVVWGGDLAYANGDPRNAHRWYDFLEVCKDVLIDSEGRQIPILVTLGNHELFGVRRLEGANEMHLLEELGVEDGEVTFFFDLFAMPGRPGYNVLDFGDYMSVILLDSDHHNPVVGEQTEWLARVLAERQDRPHVFPVYHVPAYPSARSPDGGSETRVRENWVPLFERYGVRVAFENHDHTYKRSYPLRQNRISADGIVYIGDGAWGVSTRQIGQWQGGQKAWYLDRAESVRHFILATIHGPHQHFLMVDEDGNVFDEYPQTANGRLQTYDAMDGSEVVATP
jgi:acid phosphatase type 7